MSGNLQILPCPFCGGPAEVEQVGVGDEYVTFTVGCNESGGTIECMGYQSLSTYPTRKAAIAAWNTRAPIQIGAAA